MWSARNHSIEPVARGKHNLHPQCYGNFMHSHLLLLLSTELLQLMDISVTDVLSNWCFVATCCPATQTRLELIMCYIYMKPKQLLSRVVNASHCTPEISSRKISVSEARGKGEGKAPTTSIAFSLILFCSILALWSGSFSCILDSWSAKITLDRLVVSFSGSWSYTGDLRLGSIFHARTPRLRAHAACGFVVLWFA